MKKIEDIKILSKEEFLSLESTKKQKKIHEEHIEHKEHRKLSEQERSDLSNLIEQELYESYKSSMRVTLEQLERANNGDAQAQYTVGTFFQNKNFLGMSWEDAKYYYVKAAEQNQPFAALQLALHLRNEISERKKEGRLDNIDQLMEEAKRYYRIYKDHRTGPKECDVTYPEFKK